MSSNFLQENWKAVFVVPLYNAPPAGPWNGNVMATDLASRVPSSKKKLQEDLADVGSTGLIRMGDQYTSHRQLDYDRWEKMSAGAFMPYGDTKGQEPYFIMRKAVMPVYDVLYWGISGDKIEQVEEVQKEGFQFLLHPDLWAVHFDSVGLGDSWLVDSRRMTWRANFVRMMHELTAATRVPAWTDGKMPEMIQEPSVS